MLLIDMLCKVIFVKYFFIIFGIIFITYLMITNFFDKILNLIILYPKIVNKFNIGINDKYIKIDTKCYPILYNVYNLIDKSIINININKILIDKQSLLQINNARQIFYGVKRNKNLIKSSCLLIKIFDKFNYLQFNKYEIDDIIICLIVLVLNKHKNKTNNIFL